MSTRRTRAAVSCVLSLGIFASQACRAPTQAELDISTNAECSEVGAVALVVSGDPQTAESRVAQGFFAAQTTACDVNHFIGSLVVTPGDETAAVIVITPPVGTPISDCQPPKYTGCIVARRAFSFIDHVSLKIPISLDVECRDVPCDAFSTCRKGSCYSSSTSCDDTGTCLGAGELPDGGLSPDAAILVDGSPPHDGAPDDDGSMPPVDGGMDSGDASDSGDADTGVVGPPVDAGGNISCNGGTLECASTACGVGQACCVETMVFPPITGCGTSAVAPCTLGKNPRYCCKESDCQSFMDTPHCLLVVGGGLSRCASMMSQ